MEKMEEKITHIKRLRLFMESKKKLFIIIILFLNVKLVSSFKDVIIKLTYYS